MSDPKKETQEAPQSPDAAPPECETFRKSSEWDISGKVKELEQESVGAVEAVAAGGAGGLDAALEPVRDPVDDPRVLARELPRPPG
jgi:hypothetical protein